MEMCLYPEYTTHVGLKDRDFNMTFYLINLINNYIDQLLVFKLNQ